MGPANAAAPTPAPPGRSARSRRAQTSLGKPDARSFSSSPESFPAMRGRDARGKAGGGRASRGRCCPHHPGTLKPHFLQQVQW
ncbi:hypothetical protein A8D61_33245 [Burkholderia cenocepacia]|nr:hypothetical protein A8D61_33245 [Burkholderia cenocepacia]ONJ11424.1 hypothetical protein A8D82_32775 [Burkholderia cenocepacia]ONN81293.1 hypothetical protein A8D64_27830 [Burkholderia cenocepacia]ONN86976.1 hypothetical protein A8D62_23305 [Burkholderia cenocepacia]ONN87968.1 hypothetical protein A8D63_18395 [Burkholderia cenocepacia]